MAYAWSLLGVYKNIAKQIWEEDGPKIDSTTLRLNYKVTVSFLLVSSCVVTFHNWFGLGEIPIECICHGEKPSYLDDYCWLHPKKISIAQDKWDADHFNDRLEGIGINTELTDWKDCSKNNCDEPDVFASHYYQWTAFFLLFQAICFYVPRFVWVRWENGTMAFFKKTLDVTDKTDEQKADIAAEMLIERSEKGFNDMYSLGFMVSEVVSVVNIIFQWVITTGFLGTIDTDWAVGSINFYNIGWKVMTGGDDCTRPYLPMRMMFPRQCSCVFQKYMFHSIAIAYKQ